MHVKSSAALVVLLSAAAVQAQHHPEPKAPAGKAVLLEGTGNIHHPVSTQNPEAQRFFDQGLRMIYGFNHGEADRSFRHAAALDPKLAMAWWGVALSLGPNYNAPMEPEAHGQAWEALQNARSLRGEASERERAWIDALSELFNKDPKVEIAPLQKRYAEAMRKVAAKYPDDLNAQTLFAESLMNLEPWRLWTSEGKPSPVTEEVVRTLEGVQARDPDHMGANHYYIHAVEASTSPQRALTAAGRLERAAPALGHLVHMPAHIYMRTGDYESAARVNIDAAAADRRYVENGGVRGIYLGYWAHNLHFLSAARSMQGRYADSQAAAKETYDVLAPVAEMPGVEPLLAARWLVPVRFRDWKTVLSQPAPDPKNGTLTNLWHFAQGMAHAGQGDVAKAQRDLENFRQGIANIDKERKYGFNFEKDVMPLPLFLLQAKIAEARGDLPQAIAHAREAVAAEDTLSYNEPPDWYYPPSREALGALLLRAGQYRDAEDVFRADLRRNQRNGRSLFGLYETLKAAGRPDAASLIGPLYRKAWQYADRPLTVAELF